MSLIDILKRFKSILAMKRCNSNQSLRVITHFYELNVKSKASGCFKPHIFVYVCVCARLSRLINKADRTSLGM